MTRILITSALPYINGIKHLGTLAGSMLPADVYARFQRARGRETIYICATDEHGTPAEIAAAEAGLDRSAALYRSTVFAAFQNVADVLQTVEADRKLFVAADRGVKAASVNLDLTRRLLAQRLASALQVLSAQEMHARTRSAYAQAK